MSKTKNYLESLIEAQTNYAESLRKELAHTKDSIIQIIKTESQASQNSQQNRALAQQAGQVSQQNGAHAQQASQVSQQRRAHVQHTSLGQIQKDLTHLLEITEVILAQDAVLDMLWFESITMRQRSVDPAHKATFRWLLYEAEYNGSIFEDETENLEWFSVLQRRLKQEALKRRESRGAFLDWLSIGSGVFYISGKAGAGKSTLMKFLSQEEKTRQELQAWAEGDGKRLILARFFFWNSGDQLQKSLEGLYRAILWDILRQCPDLIPSAFPDTWSAATSKERKNFRHDPSFHLELADFHAALNRIFTSSILQKPYKLCLFIDGLDEFDGDYWKLSKAVSSWAATDSIKFCVSSRPHNEFITMFASDPSRHLRLHELTRRDMLEFVRCEFQGDERSAAISAETSTYYRLIEDIVERADGIFLWVGLVTYEMLKAMGNHSSSAQLYERLNHIPKGLDGIFKRMLDVIDGPERRRAARMLLIMKMDLEVEGVKPARWISTHSMMDKMMDDPSMLDTIWSGATKPQTTARDWKSSYPAIAVRLIARCNGLVEIAPFDPAKSIFTDPKLQFVHRSVSEFLDDEEIRDKLLKLAGGFCPWMALVHSMLAVLKFLDLGERDRLYAILLILHCCGKAEQIGLPPFTKEMGSLIQICLQLAKGNDDGCLAIPRINATRPDMRLSVDSGVLRIPSDDIESVIISHGIRHGCIDFPLERVAQNTALMIPRPRGGNILLATALRDLAIHIENAGEAQNAHTRGDPNNLLIKRMLTIYGSSINAPSFSCVGNIHLKSGHSDEFYFGRPSWTTWTSFLFLLSSCPPQWGLSEMGKRAGNIIDVFVEHGADISACFVICDHKKYYHTFGHKQRCKEFVSYATLPAMIERWGIPLGPKTRQRLEKRRLSSVHVWNVARIFSFFGLTGRSKMNIQQVDAQTLISGGVKVVKVVAFKQLQDINVKDIRALLESHVTPGGGGLRPVRHPGPQILFRV